MNDARTLEDLAAVAAEIAVRTRRLERAEAMRRASDRLLRRVLDDLFTLVGVLTLDGVLLEINHGALVAAGLKPADTLGRPLWDTPWWSGDREAQVRLAEAVGRGAAGEAVRYDADVRTRDRVASIDFRLTPLRDRAGRVTHLVASGIDITERVQAQRERARAEAALRTRTAELDTLMETVPAAVWLAHDPEARRITGSRFAAELLRLTPARNQSLSAPEEQRPQHFRVLRDGREIPPEDLPLQRAAARGEAVCDEELRVVFDDGTYYDELVQASPVLDAAGNVTGAVGVALDITGRKQAEAALRRQAELLDQTHDAVIVWDLADGGVAFWNRAAEALYGWRREEALGRVARELLGTAHPAGPGRALEALLREHGRWEGEVVQATRDGRRLVVESRHVVVEGEGGRAMVLETSRDVTERKRVETELRESEARYRALIETSPDAIYVHQGGRITLANAQAVALLGSGTPEALVGRPVFDIIAPTSAGLAEARTARMREPGACAGLVELSYRRLDGTPIPVEANATAVPIGGRLAVQVVLRDITERKRAGEALRRAYALLDRHVGNTPLAVVEWSPAECGDGGPALLVRRWTGRAEALFGRTAEEVAGRAVPEGEILAEGERLLDRLQAAGLLDDDEARDVVTLRVRTKPGLVRHCRWHSSALRAEDGKLTILSLIEDVTARVEAEENVRRLALHDTLTGLPNRHMLKDRLVQALGWARRNWHGAAVMLLDLDNFKVVNDTLGHAAGDELLRGVAARLGALPRATDTLARLGGDEFALIQTALDGPGGAATLARKVVDALSAPFPLAGSDVQVGVSIGLALFPDDGDNHEELLRNADLALYRAKAQGRNRFVRYLPAMSAEFEARRSLERGLRHALERGELFLAYQPIVDLASGRVTAAEALMRWRHPGGGLVPPGAFIPVAEAAGLIQTIGAWALREACRQARRWQEAGRPLRVAVNLSPVQLQEPYLGEALSEALAASALPPDLLELEITESHFVDAARGAALRQADELGVRVAIDDFGVGYSCLAYLGRFQVHRIKIDRSFVEGIGRSAEAETLVKAVIRLGRSLGKRVVAEGVETAAQRDFLRRHGCDEAQGFLFARPQEAGDL